MLHPGIWETTSGTFSSGPMEMEPHRKLEVESSKDPANLDVRDLPESSVYAVLPVSKVNLAVAVWAKPTRIMILASC